MQRIACLLFVKIQLILGTSEVVDAASSHFTSHSFTRGTLPTQTFGSQIDTEYDEDISKEVVDKVDSDGLTLGITVGTQPMRLRRFGKQNIVMTELPHKSFGTQVGTAPSQVPVEERLADGLQRWGSQVSEPSEVPTEPSYGKLQKWGSQAPEVSEVPDTMPVSMSEAMVPHNKAASEKPHESSIVLSEAPLRHSWNNDIVVSEKPLTHFGTGSADVNLPINPEWHLAWESSVIETPRAPRSATAGRPGRFKSTGTQQQIAVGPESDDKQAVTEPRVVELERILDLSRYAFFAVCLACLAVEMCRPRQTQRKPTPRPLLRA